MIIKAGFDKYFLEVPIGPLMSHDKIKPMRGPPNPFGKFTPITIKNLVFSILTPQTNFYQH